MVDELLLSSPMFLLESGSNKENNSFICIDPFNCNCSFLIVFASTLGLYCNYDVSVTMLTNATNVL